MTKMHSHIMRGFSRKKLMRFALFLLLSLSYSFIFLGISALWGSNIGIPGNAGFSASCSGLIMSLMATLSSLFFSVDGY